DLYKEVKEKVEKNLRECREQIKDYEKDLERFRESDKVLREKCGGDYTFKDVKKLKKDPDYAGHAENIAVMWLYGYYSFEEYEGAYDYWRISLDYNYNPHINPRSLVGDDPSNFEQIGY